MEERLGSWYRICPQCQREVVHKNRAKCRLAENKNKVCSNCSRSNVGSANASIDTCPLCDNILVTSQTKRGRRLLEEHAQSHNKTIYELWLLKHHTAIPRCACGCNNLAPWIGWKDGFGTFVLGHNVRVEDPESKKRRLSALRDSFSKTNIGWSKGLTKETDARIKARGIATSKGRKKAFKEGRITPWLKGLTKETDERVKAISDNLASKYESKELIPWAKGLTKETDDRVLAMSKKVSLAHQNALLREHLDNIKRLNVDEIKERVERDGSMIFVRLDGEYTNYLQPNIVILCRKCGNSWNDTVKRLETCRCFVCDPSGSKAQTEITNFVKSLRPDAVTNNRSIIGSSELDVYTSSGSFAIEFNGLYWHNITKKTSVYHQTKSDLCSQKSICLFHIFEDEWRDKRLIVESMIRHRLGATVRKIDARACKIKFLEPSIRRTFFEDNHLDGDVKSESAIGLFYKDELVSAMSLRTPFHKKYSCYTEIARTCSVVNTNVRGALSRLTKAVKQHIQSTSRNKLMTYVDTRFGEHTSAWNNAGWKFEGTTAIRWWWTDYKDRFNRFRFRADKERKLSEEQVAEEAGVVKIYGCKNILYTL